MIGRTRHVLDYDIYDNRECEGPPVLLAGTEVTVWHEWELDTRRWRCAATIDGELIRFNAIATVDSRQLHPDEEDEIGGWHADEAITTAEVFTSFPDGSALRLPLGTPVRIWEPGSRLVGRLQRETGWPTEIITVTIAERGERYRLLVDCTLEQVQRQEADQ